MKWALPQDARARLVKNFAAELGQVKSAEVRTRIVGFLLQADPEYGEQVARAVGVKLEKARANLVP